MPTVVEGDDVLERLAENHTAHQEEADRESPVEVRPDEHHDGEQPHPVDWPAPPPQEEDVEDDAAQRIGEHLGAGSPEDGRRHEAITTATARTYVPPEDMR